MNIKYLRQCTLTQVDYTIICRASRLGRVCKNAHGNGRVDTAGLLGWREIVHEILATSGHLSDGASIHFVGDACRHGILLALRDCQLHSTCVSHECA